ncbi:hypothetical protein [Streptomyces sp. E-08]|uniref:hypothetical protein n=1 Tax=Streptomyces sp. E-08 TaxID=3404047 RepID=UPI003CF75E99
MPVSGVWAVTTAAEAAPECPPRPGATTVAKSGIGPGVRVRVEDVRGPGAARRAAATSRAKRLRNSGWAAYSGWTTLTATVRPSSERPRWTRPVPPAPGRAMRR